jgi:hypothetical protein
MTIITKKWLGKHGACRDSLEYVCANNYMGLNGIDFIEKLMRDNRTLDASWLIVRVMNKKQKVQYDIFAAELVIPIFEKEYPVDIRPREAIGAAKAYLKHPHLKTKCAARAAADAAAYAARAAAADAADAAADAARDAALIKILNNGLSILRKDSYDD